MVIDKLVQFLELSPDALTVSNSIKKVRPKEAIYPLSRIKWMSLRNPIILYRSKDGRRILWKNINEEGLSKKIINGFIVGIDRVVLSRVIGNTKPKLSNSIRDEISRLYKDDVEELEVLVGKQISEWTKKPNNIGRGEIL
jgi:hypothetical protein